MFTLHFFADCVAKAAAFFNSLPGSPWNGGGEQSQLEFSPSHTSTPMDLAPRRSYICEAVPAVRVHVIQPCPDSTPAKKSRLSLGPNKRKAVQGGGEGSSVAPQLGKG